VLVFTAVAIIVSQRVVDVVKGVIPIQPLMTSPIEVCSSRPASASSSSIAIGIISATASDAVEVGGAPTADTINIAAAAATAAPTLALIVVVAVVVIFLLLLLLLVSRNICILLQKEISETAERLLIT